MPDQDFDRIMREKLGGYKAAYDPQDWVAMESMLPQKNDKRSPFAWWWPAALVVSVLLIDVWLGVLLFDTKQDQMTLANSNQEQILDKHSTKTFPESKLLPQAGHVSALKEETLPRKTQSSPDGAELVKDESNNNNKHSKPLKISSINKRAGKKVILNEPSLSESSNSTLKEKNNEATDYTHVPSLDEMYSANLPYILLDSISSTYDIDNTKKVNANVRLKAKKALFGLGVNVGSYLWLTDISGNRHLGYQASLTGNVLIKRRIAIGVGIGWATINYGSNDVKPNFEGYAVPVSYTSQIQAIDVPFSLQVNCLNKGRWSLFASMGLHSLIKVKESYSYQFATDTVTPIEPVPPITPTFNNSGNIEADYNNALSGYDGRKALFARRYLPIVHLNVGCSFELAPGLLIEAAPSFQMSPTHVGIQNKRLWAAGLETGIKYYFGK
ncbi:MAG: outer membrane beta-barrel protein [Chitinophagales bacterium]|nr:outer membrane beta-barrel protein [Chitinophagales bacterium]